MGASKFSDVYDTLRKRVSLLFPNRVEIPFPYDLVRNPSTILKHGLGIKIGTGSEGETSNQFESTVNRTIGFVFTNEVIDVGGENTNLVDVTKLVIDDMYILKNSLLDLTRVSPQLIGEENIYSSDGGIEDIGDGKKKYISLEATFIFEMVQNIN